jgi:hypothetical protein
MAHHPNERGQRISDSAAMPAPKTEPPPTPTPGRSLLVYRMEELEKALDEVLRSFHERGHPGYAALRSGWIREDRVAHWRAVLDRRARP